MTSADTSETFHDYPLALQVRLRVYHETETPRSGREILIDADVPTSPSNCEPPLPCETAVTPNPTVATSRISATLASQVDLRAYTPHIFDGDAECFVPLCSLDGGHVRADLSSRAHGEGLPRIDIKLVTSSGGSRSQGRAALAGRLLCDSADTPMRARWFAIGILRGKTAANHGTLWRSALQFGASLTFTVGRRYERRVEGCADVYKTLRQIPCVPYTDVAAFMAGLPLDAQLVVVEYGGVDLADFQHPKRAVYVLGGEDCGVPPALVARAQWHVSVPTADERPSSLNVAATGAIVMYDRLVKMGRKDNSAQGTAANGARHGGAESGEKVQGSVARESGKK